MQRPSIKSPCVADAYHSHGERIAEVSFPNGAGCLISLRTLTDGTPLVEVYRTDPRIKVRRPPDAAAAPDMLAALRTAEARIGELCTMVCTLAGNPRKVRSEDYAEEIRAAIAKAEGR